jgi:hypothetical protein
MENKISHYPINPDSHALKTNLAAILLSMQRNNQIGTTPKYSKYKKGVSVITGDPGTGKTFLLDGLEKAGLNVVDVDSISSELGGQWITDPIKFKEKAKNGAYLVGSSDNLADLLATVNVRSFYIMLRLPTVLSALYKDRSLILKEEGRFVMAERMEQLSKNAGPGQVTRLLNLASLASDLGAEKTALILNFSANREKAWH